MYFKLNWLNLHFWQAICTFHTSLMLGMMNGLLIKILLINNTWFTS